MKRLPMMEGAPQGFALMNEELKQHAKYTRVHRGHGRSVHLQGASSARGTGAQSKVRGRNNTHPPPRQNAEAAGGLGQLTGR